MKLKLTVSVMLIAVLITACGGANTPQEQEPTPDVAVVRTSAASTVISQFTLTAAAFTPTTAAPTETTAPSTPSTPGATNTATTPASRASNKRPGHHGRSV